MAILERRIIHLALCALALLAEVPVCAQFPSIDKSPYLAHYRDSLKTMEYKGALPLLGKKAYQRGIDIPYPVGVMVNYYSQKQEVVINSEEVNDSKGYWKKARQRYVHSLYVNSAVREKWVNP